MQRGLELGGRYRLEGILGRGGMGEVWRAMDLRLRRPVAVKILPLSAASETDAVARFRREAEAAAALNHPGITIVHDIDEHQDEGERSLFLVMELLIGRDLRSLLSSHPDGLPVEQVTDLAAQIADALSAAHGKGVVHRDIKPANLFLLDTGRIKICDFGIARLVDATRITTTGSTAGTPLYMAPEQIKGAPVDHRTDLYAFGCVLYELLTGTTWVDTGSNTAAILYQHIDQQPTPPKSVRPEIPEHLDALVLELLAKQPVDRPQNAATVAERLRRSPDEPDLPTGGEPATLPAPPAGPPSRTGYPAPASPKTIGSDLDDIPADPHQVQRRAVILGGAGAATAALAGMAWLVHDAISASSAKASATPLAKPSATPSAKPSITPFATFEGSESSDRGGGIYSVAVSPDGKTLAAGSGDGPVLWEIPTGHTAAHVKGDDTVVQSVAFSPDGKTLASGSADGTLRLWNVATGHTVAVLVGHPQDNDVSAVAFSPDGDTLAVRVTNNTTQLWDVAAGVVRATLKGHNNGGNSGALAFSPNGRTLATDDNMDVRIWDLSTHRTSAVLPHTGSVESVAFSPTGKTLAASLDNSSTVLSNVATGHATMTLNGHADKIGSVAFSPNGKIVATTDVNVQLWSVATGRTIATLAGPSNLVASLAFSPDGKTLVTGSGDNTARLWKIK